MGHRGRAQTWIPCSIRLSKYFALPPDTLPFTLAEIQSRLQMLTAYRVDICVADIEEEHPALGYQFGIRRRRIGLLYREEQAVSRPTPTQRTLKKGDRVAILGRGMIVVERVDGERVRAVLWNRNMLKIRHKEIVWDEGNRRWEAQAQSSVVRGLPLDMIADE